MNAGDEARRLAAREAPYVAAVLLVLAALAASLLAPEDMRRAAPEAPPAAPEMDFDGHAAVYFSAFNMALLAAGAVCLAGLAARVHHRKPLIRPRQAPPAHWTWWDIVKVIAVQQAVSIVLVSLARPDGRRDAVFYGLPILASLAAVAVAVRVIVADRGGHPASVGLTLKEWPRFLWVGAVAFLAFWPVHLGVMAAVSWLLKVFEIELPYQDAVRLMAGEEDAATLVVLALHAALVAPLVEEFFFRGMVIPLLERRMPGWLAVGVSAAIFAVVHGNARAVVPIFLLGLVLGYVFRRTRSLVAPVTLHFVYNVVALLLILTLRSMSQAQ